MLLVVRSESIGGVIILREHPNIHCNTDFRWIPQPNIVL